MATLQNDMQNDCCVSHCSLASRSVHRVVKGEEIWSQPVLLLPGLLDQHGTTTFMLDHVWSQVLLGMQYPKKNIRRCQIAGEALL